jgi:hypothetical protein
MWFEGRSAGIKKSGSFFTAKQKIKSKTDFGIESPRSVDSCAIRPPLHVQSIVQNRAQCNRLVWLGRHHSGDRLFAAGSCWLCCSSRSCRGCLCAPPLAVDSLFACFSSCPRRSIRERGNGARQVAQAEIDCARDDAAPQLACPPRSAKREHNPGRACDGELPLRARHHVATLEFDGRQYLEGAPLCEVDGGLVLQSPAHLGAGRCGAQENPRRQPGAAVPILTG